MKTKRVISLISLLTASIVVVSISFVVMSNMSESVSTNQPKPYTVISSGNLGLSRCRSLWYWSSRINSK